MQIYSYPAHTHRHTHTQTQACVHTHTAVGQDYIGNVSFKLQKTNVISNTESPSFSWFGKTNTIELCVDFL